MDLPETLLRSPFHIRGSLELALLELLPSDRILLLQATELFEVGTHLLEQALPSAGLDLCLQFRPAQRLDALRQASDFGISDGLGCVGETNVIVDAAGTAHRTIAGELEARGVDDAAACFLADAVNAAFFAREGAGCEAHVAIVAACAERWA